MAGSSASRGRCWPPSRLRSWSPGSASTPTSATGGAPLRRPCCAGPAGRWGVGLKNLPGSPLTPLPPSRRAPAPASTGPRATALLAGWSARRASAVTGAHGRWAPLGAGTIVLAVALVLLSPAQVGDPASASRILTADSEYNRSHRAVQEEFGGSEPFLVVAEGDGPGALQRAGVLRTIEQFQ